MKSEIDLLAQVAPIRVAVRAGRALPPTAKQKREAENAAALGGMRRLDTTVRRVPNAEAVGGAIRQELLTALRESPDRSGRLRKGSNFRLPRARF